jgi:hypothetical protein
LKDYAEFANSPVLSVSFAREIGPIDGNGRKNIARQMSPQGRMSDFVPPAFLLHFLCCHSHLALHRAVYAGYCESGILIYDRIKRFNANATIYIIASTQCETGDGTGW